MPTRTCPPNRRLFIHFYSIYSCIVRRIRGHADLSQHVLARCDALHGAREVPVGIGG